ncbi:A disintegrin and metalloproteinase with thrombospondin motifs adt-2-like [Centruroides vittatus]|uniref:A disintegrin and metalloproteinase with thrombospondin motifs adt-2-like n=1 Tax=Centruroides vittatus TaxID=120091 RepID=UPI00351078FD
MRASKLHLFFSIIQVIQIRNCFLLKQNKISDDIVYPLLYHTPRDKRDISDNTKEKLLIIRTSNTTFYIELIPNNELLSEDFEFEGFTYENHSSNPCLFHGKILSQSGGMAAISTCEGDGKMHGLLVIPEGKYTMQPASSMQPHLDFPIEKESVPHVLLKNTEDIEKFCATDHIAPPVDIEDNEVPNVHVRRRRSKPRYTIRMAVFVDKSLIDHYSDKKVNVKFAILNILNQVQFIYKYDSLKTQIDIRVVKLDLNVDEKNVPDKANGDIDRYLNNFCLWQKEKKRRSKEDWNFAFILTGIDLYKLTGSASNKKVLGLAWVNGMCRDSYSCAISEARSFEAAYVMSHEMGHCLSMMHDGSNNSCNPDKYIMSPKTGPGKTNWSPCSNRYLEDFLRMPQSSCLLDDKNAGDLTSEMDPRLPGQKYPPRIQCEYALGKGYKIYNNSKPPYNNICRELWCVQGYWATPAHPALEGSSCGQNKMCLQGDCVRKLKSIPKTRSSTEKSPVHSKVENNNENQSPTFIDKIRSFMRTALDKLFSGK